MKTHEHHDWFACDESVKHQQKEKIKHTKQLKPNMCW